MSITFTSPQNVNSRRPTLTGKALPWSQVHHYLSGGAEYYGYTTADSSGSWQHVPTTDLKLDSNGNVTISGCIRNEQGQQTSPWVDFAMNVSGTGGGAALPYGSAPTLTSPTTVTSLRPTLTGIAAPRSYIRIFRSGGSPEYGYTYADDRGQWTFTPPTNLIVDGSNQANIAMAVFSQTGQMESDWVNIALHVTGSGGGTTLPPGSAPVLTSSTNVNTPRPTMTGLARPHSRVKLFHKGGAIIYADVQVDATGRWVAVPSVNLNHDINGNVPIDFAEFDQSGAQLSGWVSVTLNVNGSGGGTALPSGSPPVLHSPTTVNSFQPLMFGSAASNAIIQVFHSGGSPHYGTAFTDITGRWQITPSTNLQVDTNRNVKISIAEFDQNGAQKSPWANYTLTVNY